MLGGWSLNAIWTFQSGQPFTPFFPRFDPFRNEAFNRPDVVGDPRRDVPDGFAFNPAAFASAELGRFGNAGRNIVRGDGYHSADLSVFRTFARREGVSLQFRIESMNVLNTANLQGPVTDLSAAGGQFVASAPPRIFQLGLKLTF